MASTIDDKAGRGEARGHGGGPRRAGHAAVPVGFSLTDEEFALLEAAAGQSRAGHGQRMPPRPP